MTVEGDLSPFPPRERFIYGRTFIETEVLNLLDLERRNPSPEAKRTVAKSLDDLICILGLSEPSVTAWYIRSVVKLVSELYSDMPKPELKPCMVFDQLRDHLFKNRKALDPRAKMGMVPRPMLEMEAELVACEIVKKAAISALIASGFIWTGREHAPYR